MTARRTALVIVFSLAIVAAAAMGMASIVSAMPPSAGPMPSATPTLITIKDFVFTPKVVSIPIGGSVTWKNLDQAAHTVTDTSAHAFDSGSLAIGKTYTFTFAKPGVYKYICTVHPSMVATILVGPNATMAPTPSGASDESEGPDRR
jgi:plastocyanin